MKALITKASDWEYEETKEVNSIEDILKIYPEVVLRKIDDSYVSLFGNKYKGYDIEIKIYDDWME